MTGSKVFRMKHALRFTLCAVVIFFSLPCVANAQGLIQGVSGLLEFDYSFLTTKTKDATGVTTKTQTSNYNPRFTLNIDTKIYPNLRLHAGGIAEGSITDSKTADAIDTKTTTTRFRPYIDLTLETPLYAVGIGYIRREERTKTSGSPSTTLVDEEYYAILRWRPEGLPYIDMQIKRTNNFDQEKILRDIKEDYISLNSKYTYKGLQLNYQGAYTNTNDDLNNLVVTQYTHSGRVAYSDSFFDKRVLLNSIYNVFYQEVKTVTGGKGLVSSQIFPFAGFSALNDIPAIGALDPNPAIIDGDLTASAGINIGLPAPGGDARPRNIGIDFLNVTEVNQLLVYVDRDLSSSPLIANSFSWQVWTSSDNLNWSLVTTISPAPFGPFQNRFEINFLNVKTRYIKVVTNPLSPAVPAASSFPNIFVTELQAFLNSPAADVVGRMKTASHTYNLDAKARILDSPILFYDFYFFFNRVNPSSQQSYTVSNGLSLNYRFSPVFSTTARVAREDGEAEDERRFAYVYNASIVADSLKTVRNSLVFSGRDEEIEGRPNNLNSIFLYNTAQLYKGIDVNLNGGVNFTKQESGERGRDFVINFQTNIVPYRTITLGLNYSNTISRRTGGDQGPASTYTQTLNFNFSYNPLRTLNLIAFVQYVSENAQKDRILQNYAINWSPFPDGALQFNLAYNQNFRTEDQAKETILQPSIRYNISKNSYINVSYQIIRTKSAQKENSNLFSTSLKLFF
jgi:hypothetical protein